MLKKAEEEVQKAKEGRRKEYCCNLLKILVEYVMIFCFFPCTIAINIKYS